MTEWIPIVARTEWLRWRQDFLTASDVAACAGVDKFKSRARLYAEKADRAPGAVENGAMRRGRLFEVAALEYLKEEKPGWMIDRPNVFVADPETRLACTPDALATAGMPGTINVQIKTISRPAFERWDGVAPLGYVLQVTAENLLLDAASGVLCVLVVSNFDAELKLFDVPRHEKAEARIVEIAREFWADVANGRRPEPDFTRDADLIAEMFPRPDPAKTIDLSGNNWLAKMLPERNALKEEIANREALIKTIDAEVQYMIGDAEVAELPGWRLTWRLEHRREFTVAASERRVLRVKQIEEKTA